MTGSERQKQSGNFCILENITPRVLQNLKENTVRKENAL
jgi:hypothetical protein